MGNLKKTDLLLALVFGCIISLLCFQFQSPKKERRVSLKKEKTQTSVAYNSSHPSYEKHIRHRRVQSNSKRILASVDESLTYSEENEYTDSENDPIAENEKNQIEHEVSLFMNRKLESYLLNQIGLPAGEISKIMASKLLMEDEIMRNNKSLPPLASEEANAELQILNQQALSRHQEELKQILGPENYQRYTIWQSEQDAAVAESYAGGKPLSMDEI